MHPRRERFRCGLITKDDNNMDGPSLLLRRYDELWKELPDDQVDDEDKKMNVGNVRGERSKDVARQGEGSVGEVRREEEIGKGLCNEKAFVSSDVRA
jgi:hypothetical protein